MALFGSEAKKEDKKVEVKAKEADKKADESKAKKEEVDSKMAEAQKMASKMSDRLLKKQIKCADKDSLWQKALMAEQMRRKKK